MNLIKCSNENYVLDMKRIKPKNIKNSDKYSKQIYEFLRQHPRHNKVYYVLENSEEVGNIQIDDILNDLYKTKLNDIWIGNIDAETTEIDGVNIQWMSGNSLFTIISPSKNKYTLFANPWNTNKTVIDITEKFWEKYISIGRCMYGNHPLGLTDDNGRFTYITPTHRKCKWCGKEEYLVEEVVSYTRKVWKENVDEKESI